MYAVFEFGSVVENPTRVTRVDRAFFEDVCLGQLKLYPIQGKSTKARHEINKKNTVKKCDVCEQWKRGQALTRAPPSQCDGA